jgi:voltage-gated potassium channel Kch
VVDDLIARIIAQTCRQSGVSSVYEQLLDFAGDEIYFSEVPDHMVGETYGDSLLRFDTCTVIGVAGRSGVVLDPPQDRVLEEGDRLIVIAADEASVLHAHAPVGVVKEETILPAPERVRPPERTLVLEWNRRASRIIAELDHYVAPGSSVSVVAPAEPAPASVAALRESLEHQTVGFRVADATDRDHLEAICAEGYDHVIVLSTDDIDPQLADARTLMTLLHLRELGARHGYGFSITSEMVDLRNRDLAQVTRADDFIVSDRISSLILSQLAEDADLKAVFDDLFDSEGAEVYLHCAAEYVESGAPTTYATVVEAARRRGETAIGYRDNRLADDVASRFGVVLNPPKTRDLVLTEEDRVIVIADEG